MDRHKILPHYLWLFETGRDQHAAKFLSDMALELNSEEHMALCSAIYVALKQSTDDRINSYLWVAIKRSLYIKRKIDNFKAIVDDENYLDHAVALEFCRLIDFDLQEDAYAILKLGSFAIMTKLKEFIAYTTTTSQRFLVPQLPCIEEYYGEKTPKPIQRFSENKEG